MCGIFCIYPTHKMKRFHAKRLLMGLSLLNDDRGGHSHGLFGNTIKTMRGLGALAGSRAMNRALREWGDNLTEGAWIAGHTRYATHGSVTVQNAHPFEVEDIVLAHNGMVDVAGYDSAHHDVDSARIALAIRDFGMKKAMSKTSGSIGLVLGIEGNLMIYRSDQVLHIAEGKWGWVVSSAKDHLEEAMAFAGLKAKVKAVEKEKFLAPWYGWEPIPAPAAPQTNSSKEWWQYKGYTTNSGWASRSTASSTTTTKTTTRVEWDEDDADNWISLEPCESCLTPEAGYWRDEFGMYLCYSCKTHFASFTESDVSQ